MLLLVVSFACGDIGFCRFWEFGACLALYCYDRCVFELFVRLMIGVCYCEWICLR